MYHRIFGMAVAAALCANALSSVATAQSAAPVANHDAGTPAIASPNQQNPRAPIAGANSFSRAQARSRIEQAGFANVSGLAKDKDGIWRGTAVKDGTTYHVALDYQGNVVAR